MTKIIRSFIRDLIDKEIQDAIEEKLAQVPDPPELPAAPRTHNEALLLRVPPPKEEPLSKSDRLKATIVSLMNDPDTIVFWATCRRHFEEYNDGGAVLKVNPTGSYRVTLEVANRTFMDRWPIPQEGKEPNE